MSLAGCAHVPWTPKYVAAPVKRHHASEERAVQALDEYFNAAKDLVGLSQARIHDRCLDAYWDKTAQNGGRPAGPDEVCSFVLKRFDAAAQNIAGYGQSPSGKYPWLGEVFEYVLRTQTLRTKEEKMASLDSYAIKKFEDLMSGPTSPVIARVAKDFYVIRGTCCREVTVFDDWYKARFDRLASK
jgi:hypothetical protein